MKYIVSDANLIDVPVKAADREPPRRDRGAERTTSGKQVAEKLFCLCLLNVFVRI